MILSAEQLSFSYPGGEKLLNGLSFAVKSGEFVSVLGPNGAGKTTLFRCLLGALPDFSGRILLDGKDLNDWTPKERAAKLAYLPQSHRFGFHYTVREVVLMGLSRRLSAFAAPGEKEEKMALDALKRVHAEGLQDRDFSELSGGEQQLVLIARALAQNAGLLILDEPTSALDFGNRIHILSLLRELTREGYGVLLSSHEPQHALDFSDKVLALSGDGTAFFGPTGEVLTEKLLLNLYGISVTLWEGPNGTILLPEIPG